MYILKEVKTFHEKKLGHLNFASLTLFNKLQTYEQTRLSE